MENVPGYIFLGIILILGIACAVRFLQDKCSPVKTVKATVVHKQTVEAFSKYSGTGKHTKYAVTFQAGQKKLSFYVSEFSYRGYKIKETGTLKYKGSRIIDFS
ncbi:MAG: DUF2500 domain-containing protein [Ruminococcaceae bacterium]|nr:DUF2500 domain-containing protein [Oscillospiraceae bacterium]